MQLDIVIHVKKQRILLSEGIMSSVRLTNSLRDTIAKNALKKSGVIAAQEENGKAFSALAEKVRVKCLGGTEKAAEMESKREKINKMVSELRGYGVFGARTCYLEGEIRTSFGGLRTILGYGKDSAGESIHRLTPHQDKCFLAADDPLTIEFHKLENEERSIREKVKEVEANVYAALNSVTTIKRLLAVWPECEELLPEPMCAAKAAMPALVVSDLNKMIGLPTDNVTAR